MRNECSVKRRDARPSSAIFRQCITLLKYCAFSFLVLFCTPVTTVFASTHSFGPAVTTQDRNSPSLSFSVPVNPNITSNATLSVTVIGDLNSSGGGIFGGGSERLRTLLEGSQIDNRTVGQCVVTTFTRTISASFLAPLIADGTLNLTFRGGPSTDNICNGSGPFAGNNSISLGIQGSITYDNAPPPNPAFNLTHNVDETTISGPDLLTYTVTIENTGNVSLTGASVTDSLTQAGNTISLTTPYTRSGDKGTPNVLDVGETWTYTATFNAQQTEIDDGDNIVSSFEIDFTETAAKSADATTSITQTPDFTISHSVDNPTISGPGLLTYTVTVENTGNVSLTGASVTDSLTQAGNTISLTTPYTRSGDGGTPNVLDVGETWTYTATFNAQQTEIDDGDNIVSSFEIDFTETAAKSADATTSITQNPTFSVTVKPDVTSVNAQGDIINYAIRITNTGNVTLTGLTIADPLLSNENCPVNSIAVNNFIDCTGSYTVQQTDLDNNGIDENGAIDGDGDIDSLVTVNTHQFGPQIASATVGVVQNPALTAVKSSSNNSYSQTGDVLNYSIVVTNSGNLTLTNLIVDDPLTPDESCPVNMLSPGSSTTCTASYTVVQTDLSNGSVTNTASVNTDQTPTQNTNTVIINFDPTYIRERTKRVITNFMSRRADQITANDPELVTRLQNRGSEGETGQFAGFTAEGTLTNNKLAFSTSLRQMMMAKEYEKSELRKGLGDMMSLGTQSLTQNIDPNGWDLWVKGTWSQTENDTATNDLGLLYLGIDYRFSPTLLVGFLTQFDWSDETDSVENIAVKGEGWMVGSYVVARLHENLLFDGRAAWGQSENDVNPLGTYTDQFDTTRWLLRGQLTGDFSYENLKFSPHVRVIYFEEKQEAYVDSLNIDIPSQTISLGRLTFGPTVSTTIKTPDGSVISPHVSLKGIWDFDKAEVVDLDTGLATGSSEDVRARIEGGLSVQMSNGWSLIGEGFYDGIGAKDLEAYGGSVKLTVPLN